MNTPKRKSQPWCRRIGGAFVILVLASMCATAQLNDLPRTPMPTASATVESKTGDVSGRVVNESGQPLGNAFVYVIRDTQEGRPSNNTSTDRNGVFKVSGLEPGSYSVRAAMPGYIPKPFEAGSRVQTVGDSVTLVLIKAGVITGTVTNSKGEPVVGIGVRVQLMRDEAGRQMPVGYNYDGMTDDRGIYRVYGLPSGAYIVAADGSADYSPTGVNGFASEMPTYAPSSNREAADEINVRVGEEISNVDIRYRGERGNTISGVVSGLPKENRGFWVTLNSMKEGGPRWNIPFRAAGEFAFEGIPDGDYHLVATAHLNDSQRGTSETLVLIVRGADIEGISLTPTPLASISGRVVLEPLKESPPECTDKRQPVISEASVTAYHRVTQDNKKKPQFVLRAGGGVSPNAQGNITLPDLPANEYYFGVRFSPQEWYLRSIAFASATANGEPVDATRTWTTVKPGEQLSGLTVTLTQGAALVRGEITLAEGQKLPEKLTVYLVPAEAEKAEVPLRYFAAPVNSDGRFWLNNVAPGRYWMVAQPRTDDTRYDVSKVRLPDGGELRSLLRHAAEQAKTEIELKPCQDVNFRLKL